MVGANHVLGFALLVYLPSHGFLYGHRHGGHGLLGFVMGSAAIVAVLSGYLLWLTALDFLERKKFPNRTGLRAWAAGVSVGQEGRHAEVPRGRAPDDLGRPAGRVHERGPADPAGGLHASARPAG